MVEVINNTPLNSTAFHVYRVIRALQKQRGFCWISNEALAKEVRISKSYLSHLLTALDRAGLIYRNIVRDDKGEISYRQMVAFKEAKETAVSQEEFDKLVADRTEQGFRNRLIANGKNINIAPTVILKAIMQYGAEKVDVALGITKASCSCVNPVKYFFAALKHGWKAGKRAAGYIGQVFRDARRRKVSLPDVKIEELHAEKSSEASYAFDKSLTVKEKIAIFMDKVKGR